MVQFTFGAVAIGMLAALTATATTASAADLDFSNPAVALSSDAVVASGSCIAKYTVRLDDLSISAEVIAGQVAEHCAKEISLAAGMSAFLAGKPEDFTKNLKYVQEELTKNAVMRHRTATDATKLVQLR